MSEPKYEAEDCGCHCTKEEGVTSEWEWDESQECYICSVCGEVQ